MKFSQLSAILQCGTESCLNISTNLNGVEAGIIKLKMYSRWSAGRQPF
jgi:hypothetical protein